MVCMLSLKKNTEVDSVTILGATIFILLGVFIRCIYFHIVVHISNNEIII